MSSSSSLGTPQNPLTTTSADISPGTAVVIGTAASSIILTQAVIRSWRAVSLAKFHSLHLGRIHILTCLLIFTTTIAILGSFLWFPDDARSFGGLYPSLGVLAPFIFLTSRPLHGLSSAQYPTRIRFLNWLLLSPINLIFMIPAFSSAAVCIWLMVRANSWDVIALVFSLVVALITQTDPPLHFAWNGMGPRWQWGVLLPSPVRANAWRFVVGRAHDSDGQIEISVDAMEVPTSDAAVMSGRLVDESMGLSDRTLASSIAERGVLESLSHFYEYVNVVWTKIIHDVKNGSLDEAHRCHQAGAGACLLVFSVLKEALQDNVRIGADVWLWLAILRMRLDDIYMDYVEKRETRKAPFLQRLFDFNREVWSMFAGRQRQIHDLPFTNERLNDVEAGQNEEDTDMSGENNADETMGTTKTSGLDPEATENIPQSANTSYQKISNNGTEVNDTPLNSLNFPPNNSEITEESVQDHDGAIQTPSMFFAFEKADEPPSDSDPEEWKTWITSVLESCYSTTLKFHREEWNKDGNRTVAGLPDTFHEYLGDDCMDELDAQILEMLLDPISSQNRSHNGSFGSSQGERSPKTCVEEVTVTAAENEAWSYVMLSMAKRHIVSAADTQGFRLFESAGFDVISIELNGRMIAQNTARKIMLGQLALWSYVVLGQTVDAFLARN